MLNKKNSVHDRKLGAQQNILILARPQNLQTRFGFSTKLAEYMASGVAVLTTDVSDNLLFIKDGENGFIADSYKAEKVADKLFDIVNNKKYLDKKIIECANVTATKYFNSKKYKDKLARFLFSENNEPIVADSCLEFSSNFHVSFFDWLFSCFLSRLIFGCCYE